MTSADNPSGLADIIGLQAASVVAEASPVTVARWAAKHGIGYKDKWGTWLIETDRLLKFLRDEDGHRGKSRPRRRKRQDPEAVKRARLSTRIEIDLMDEVEAKSAALGVSVSEFIRRALEKAVNGHRPASPQSET